MKFDDQLAAYLYENKSLTLEGIGTFSLNNDIQVPYKQEKEISNLTEGIAFNYNPKSNTDEKVIAVLVKKLGKIEPLIRSDLESYLSNIKQFLNIGNPYTIEGIGTLSKNNEGMLEFTAGNFQPVREEPRLNRPKRENQDHDHPERSGNSTGRNFVITLIIIAAIGGIGWAVLNFIQNQQAPDEVATQQSQTDTIIQQRGTDTTKTDTNTVHDSTHALAATANSPEASKDSVSYKMIFEITKSKERVNTRIAQLNNLHSNAQYDSVPINDSVAYYRLFLLMKVPSADLDHVKDSLKIFFGKKISIEKQ